MFAIMWYPIDVIVADYTRTLIMDLSSDGKIMRLPPRQAWKIVRKSLKRRRYAKYAITKLNLMLVGFAQNGSNSS